MDLFSAEPRDLLTANPEWVAVLNAYLDQEHLVIEQAKREQASLPEDVDSEEKVPRPSTHWLTRLHDVEGVAMEHLAPIHGKLISLGLLKFNLQGRERGIEYTLSKEARQLVNQLGSSGDQDQDGHHQDESIAA